MKKIVYLLVFFLLALSALGLGYAGWSKNLSITGTITPGQFAAKIDLENPFLVSSAEYATIVEGESTDSNIVINIDKAAAGNVFTVHYIIFNDGNIPVEVTFSDPVIAAAGPGATASDISINIPLAPIELDENFSQSGDFTITINDSTPTTGDVSYTINVGITVTPP